jgi:hypothetical protein
VDVGVDDEVMMDELVFWGCCICNVVLLTRWRYWDASNESDSEEPVDGSMELVIASLSNGFCKS